MIQVPQDILVAHLIPELLVTLRVPQRLEDGRPLFYVLHSKALGRPLDSTLTIRQNGVASLDALALHPLTMAG